MEPEQLPEIATLLESLRRVAVIQREEIGPRTYTYLQLSEEAKEKVRDRYRENNRDDNFIDEIITDTFNYRLSKLGYQGEYKATSRERPEGLEVPWSLGYCQGDGVAFEGLLDDQRKVTKRLLSAKDFQLLDYCHRSGSLEGTSILDNLSVNVINTNHHYYHWNSFRVETGAEGLYYVHLTARQESVIALLRESIQKELVSLSREFEALGYKIIEESNEDDYVDEEIISCWEDKLYYVDGEESQ